MSASETLSDVEARIQELERQLDAASSDSESEDDHGLREKLELAAAYEPSRRRANWCRTCSLEFNGPEEVKAHFQTNDHKLKLKKERADTFCSVCRVQTTSPAQFIEHCNGSKHLENTERRSSKRRRR